MTRTRGTSLELVRRNVDDEENDDAAEASGADDEEEGDAEPDAELVDEAVSFIQDTMKKSVDRGLVEIGEYLFKTFFESDPDVIRSRSGSKAATFQALLDRCGTIDLPLKKTTVYEAVSVVAMQHQLGAGQSAFKQLPRSHQVALLPVRDPKKVEKLAARALSKKLTVRDLREEVAEERANVAEDEPRRGRPPSPVVLKALNRALSLFRVEGRVRAFTKAQVDELDDEQRAAALKVARQIVAHLEGLIAKLE